MSLISPIVLYELVIHRGRAHVGWATCLLLSATSFDIIIITSAIFIAVLRILANKAFTLRPKPPLHSCDPYPHHTSEGQEGSLFLCRDHAGKFAAPLSKGGGTVFHLLPVLIKVQVEKEMCPECTKCIFLIAGKYLTNHL